MMIRECGWVGKKKGNRKSTSFTLKEKKPTYVQERKKGAFVVGNTIRSLVVFDKSKSTTIIFLTKSITLYQRVYLTQNDC